MGLSKKEEREYAKMLFVNDRLTVEQVAERVGVSARSIGRWKTEDNWEHLRKSLLITKEKQLTHWYNQLDAMNEAIAKREPAVPESKEADTMSKISANIKRLEVETGLGEYVEVGRKVLQFIQEVDLSHAKLFKDYFDEFISSKLKGK